MNETKQLLDGLLERIEERYTEEMKAFRSLENLLGKERSGSDDIIREIRKDIQHEPEHAPEGKHSPLCGCTVCLSNQSCEPPDEKPCDMCGGEGNVYDHDNHKLKDCESCKGSGKAT